MCIHCVDVCVSIVCLCTYPPPPPPPIPIHTTNSFWLSTILLVVVSVCSFHDWGYFSECVAFGKVSSKSSGLKIKYYDVFGWLNWLDAELSPKGYWWGLRSQEVGEGRGRRLYLMLLCHNLNDSCIKMGSDESHFNVSSSVEDKVTRQCTPTTTFQERGEPKSNWGAAYQPNALTLCHMPAHMLNVKCRIGFYFNPKWAAKNNFHYLGELVFTIWTYSRIDL